MRNGTSSIFFSLTPFSHENPTLINIVKAVGEALSLRQNITPHDFRAAFVSIARRHKLDTKTIMNATGHSNAAMIDYYDIREHLETNAVLFFTSLFDKY